MSWIVRIQNAALKLHAYHWGPARLLRIEGRHLGLNFELGPLGRLHLTWESRSWRRWQEGQGWARTPDEADAALRIVLEQSR